MARASRGWGDGCAAGVLDARRETCTPVRVRFTIEPVAPLLHADNVPARAGNEIGSDGATMLARALSENCTLTSVSLESACA